MKRQQLTNQPTTPTLHINSPLWLPFIGNELCSVGFCCCCCCCCLVGCFVLFCLPVSLGFFFIPSWAKVDQIPETSTTVSCVKKLSELVRSNRHADGLPRVFTVSSHKLVGWLVACLLNVPATCECISGTDLLRQFDVLPH